MTAGPVLSGTKGKLYKKGSPDTEIEFGKWTFQEEIDTERYASSGTDGHKGTEPGNASATGTVEGKRTTDATKIESIVALGAKIILKLGFDDTVGIEVPVVIKSRQFEVDPSTGAIESFQFTFESNGAWTYY